MLTLYHCTDARSFRCLWALEEARTPYQLMSMPFPPRRRAPEFLKLNPTGTVPLLIDGTDVLFESAAILEYLAVKYAPTSLAVARDDPQYGAWLNWLHFGEASLTTPLATMIRYALFEPEERRQPAVVADYRALYLERLQRVETAVREREYLLGERFTVADISVGYALQLSRMLGLHKEMPPALAAYWQRLQERPAYQAARTAQNAAATADAPTS